MMIFWTGAKKQYIDRTIGASLKACKPDIPEHAFEPHEEGQLPSVKPGDMVMGMGNKVLATMIANGIVAKGRTLQSQRETVFVRSGVKYMLTFDPAVIANEPEKADIIGWDFRLMKRYMDTGSLKPVGGDYKWVGTFAPLIARIKASYAKFKKPVRVSCDTETMGLYPEYDDKELLMIGFSDKPHYAELLYCSHFFPDPVPSAPPEVLWSQIEWLLTSPMVRLVGGNFKYDIRWIRKKFDITCTNFKFDTCLAGSLVNENRSNGLSTHARLMTDIGGYDAELNDNYDKNHMELVPLDVMLTYFGGDIDAAYQVAEVITDELVEDERLARFYIKVVHPAVRAFEDIEERGILVDQEKMAKLSKDLGDVIKEKEREALDLIPMRLRHKHAEKIAAQTMAGKSPLTPAIMSDYFFGPAGLALTPMMRTAKTGAPSTAKAHLEMFADNPKAKAMSAVLSTMNSAAKTKSTFVDGFMKHIRPDGKLHPSYMLFHGGFNDDEDDESGSTTGRLSAKEPPYQTIPNKTKWAKRLRECYPAPPGYTMVGIDYSQGELKIVACLAPEPTMLKAYENGLDLHAVTGAKLGGYIFEEFMKLKFSKKEEEKTNFKLLRDRAKPANFGLLYAMMAEGFRQYCWAQYGLKMSLKEAEDIRNAFFELYPGLLDYHANMREFVRHHEHVRSPMGRVRHLPTIRSWDRGVVSQAERQAINSPVQAALTDMMIWAAAKINAELPHDKVMIFGLVHDALYAYVKIEEVVHWVTQMKTIMETLPLAELDWHPQLVFTAEASHGPNMAALEEMKLAA